MRTSSRLFAGVPIVLGALALGCGGGGGDDDRGDGGGGAGAEEDTGTERAPAGMVQVLLPEDVDDLDLAPLAGSGAMGTETTHVAATGTADVGETGRGEAARRPAEGERFLVTQVVTTPVPVTDLVDRVTAAEITQRGKPTFGVAVDGGGPAAVDLATPGYTPLPIDLDDPPQPPVVDPAVAQTRLLVVSVPEDAEAVDLVMTSPEMDQRLSLLTGDPGPDNLSFLARPTRTMAAPVPGQAVSYHLTEFGMGDHVTETIGVTGASLQWVGPFGDTRRPAPGRAFLHVGIDAAGGNLNLATELRLPDGTVVQPVTPEGGGDIMGGILPMVVFDVPDDFTEGTFVLGKDYTWEVPTGGTMSADYDAPVEYPIALPTA